MSSTLMAFVRNCTACVRKWGYVRCVCVFYKSPALYRHRGEGGANA